MKIKAYQHKVQYYETDQMGVVHHSNYIRWFEEARLDFLEQIGAEYADMEKEGYISPVVSISCDYINRTVFGETVSVISKLERFNGVKYSLSYKVMDAATKELRATGKSSHCFLTKEGKLVSLKKDSPKFYHIMAAAVGNETEKIQ
ncbi:MAG TPA: acyl-CoA thioesterase [Lachnospiraceae bacterium]|nr:acyl-CoA thioesterase [Lachnospiraceae bacterium]